MGLAIHGDADHLVRRRHFEVELALDDFAQEAQVAILDVAAIFPQMDDDAVRSAQFRQHRGGDGVRLFAPACLAQGRHVIHVDAQPSHGCSLCGAVCSPAAIMANREQVYKQAAGLSFVAWRVRCIYGQVSYSGISISRSPISRNGRPIEPLTFSRTVSMRSTWLPNR